MLRIRFIPTTKAPISMGTSNTATKPNPTISWPLWVLRRRVVARCAGPRFAIKGSFLHRIDAGWVAAQNVRRVHAESDGCRIAVGVGSEGAAQRCDPCPGNVLNRYLDDIAGHVPARGNGCIQIRDRVVAYEDVLRSVGGRHQSHGVPREDRLEGGVLHKPRGRL